jgi:streptomycin 6-kinase
MFEPYMDLWGLTVDGEPIVTQFSRLLPVRYDGVPAMLKLLLHDEERQGAVVMEWWGGHGAARVLAREGDGLLLERATGPRSLAELALGGQDDEATRILCDVVAALHSPGNKPLPAGLYRMDDWFAPLFPAAEDRGGILTRSAKAARELLSEPRDVAVLHGDIHHGNVLDGGGRGWLAIDPKGLIGERGFDFANIFRNPEHAFGADQDVLSRRATVIAEASGTERTRILQWVLAFCGLSAVWILDNDEPSESDMAMAEMDMAIARAAAAALGGSG